MAEHVSGKTSESGAFPHWHTFEILEGDGKTSREVFGGRDKGQPHVHQIRDGVVASSSVGGDHKHTLLTTSKS